MSINLLAEAIADNRSLAQMIEGAVMRTELRREASVTHTMDKLLYEAFVQFALRTAQQNKVKFLFDVCQYRHLCKLAKGCPDVKKDESNSGTSDRRFQMLFCIVAEYIMPNGIKEITVPRGMQKKVIEQLCEYLEMGTVKHLEGMPSLGRFFELRYEQLRRYKPRSEIIRDISLKIFGHFEDEPRLTPKKILPTLFDDLVCHLSAQLQELYKEFRNTIVDLESHLLG